MTQPSPAPAPSGGSFKGITLTVPSTSSSGGSSDKYGLGAWQGQQVNPGDLPILANLIQAGSKPTTDNVVAAFAKADPQSLAEMQRALYLGGWYSTKTYVPSYGVISPEDIQAFAHAVVTAGQSGQSVSQLLLDHAKVGTAAGIATAQQLASKASSSRSVQQINVPATADLEAQAQQAFENVLGRRAKPKEAAAFAAAYRSMVVGIERANIAAEQQAVGAAAGGITGKQATGFDKQLSQVGAPQDVPALPRGLVDNPGERALAGPGGVNAAMADHQVTPGFDEQMAQLQTLGQSVADAVSQRTPAMNQGPQVIEQQQPEDASVAAANFARSTHPKGAARNDLGGAIQNFMSIITSQMGGL